MALFRTARPAALKIGCFGKLTSYGDFVSLNQDSAEARSFAEWLHQGMTQFATGLPGAQDQFVCFSWRQPDARRRLLGVFWPSADAAGRSFPFSLFVSAPTSLLDRHGAHHAHALEPLWRQLHEIYAQVRSLGSLQEQYGLIQESRSVGVPTVQDAQNSFSLRVLSIPLDLTAPKELGLQVLDVREISEQISRDDHAPFAVRMRIHNPLDPALEAAIWTRLLLRERADNGVAGSMFLRVSPSENARSLFVCRRAVRPEDLTFVLAPDLGYKFADSLGYRLSGSNEDERTYVTAWLRGWEHAQQTCGRLLDLGLADTPDFDVDLVPPTAATGPEPVTTGTLDDEITGEIDTSATGLVLGGDGLPAAPDPPLPPAQFPPRESAEPPTAPAPLPAAGDATSPLGDESTSELSTEIGSRLPEVAASRAGALATSILELLRSPLAPGQLVRLPHEGDGDGPAVFLPAGSRQAQTVNAAALQSGTLAARTKAWEEVRGKLDELRRVHRDLEEALQARFEQTCRKAESAADWL